MKGLRYVPVYVFTSYVFTYVFVLVLLWEARLLSYLRMYICTVPAKIRLVDSVFP